MKTFEEALQLHNEGKLIGTFDNLDPEIYHKLPLLSNSSLKYLNKTPKHYQAYITTPRKRREIGRAHV